MGGSVLMPACPIKSASCARLRFMLPCSAPVVTVAVAVVASHVNMNNGGAAGCDGADRPPVTNHRG